MTKSEFCYLYLTCKDVSQATKITDSLLQKRLIACAKQLPITSSYWWKDEIEHANEIMVVMESTLNLFDEIEKVVTSLHSYETFVLEAVPIAKVSKRAKKWMNGNLKNG